jgi:hypothetical protein
MSLGTVEHVSPDVPLAQAVEAAFERVRSSDATRCALQFDPNWHPTMDLVEVLARSIADSADIEVVTLVHPSAAMTFIASAIAARVNGVEVRAQRSIYDEPEDMKSDATASKTMFVMTPTESIEGFVRRSVAEAQKRVVRRFALLFDGTSVPSMDLAGLLAEELLQSGVQEIGLVHPTAPLEAVVATLRLRLPNVRVAYASQTKPR